MAGECFNDVADITDVGDDRTLVISETVRGHVEWSRSQKGVLVKLPFNSIGTKGKGALSL